jgi:hypothetical protein
MGGLEHLAEEAFSCIGITGGAQHEVQCGTRRVDGPVEELPRPDLPLTVGIDGGYVHACEKKGRHEGWFEVMAGKSSTAEGAAKCCGFVQCYDQKPKRWLFELLKSPRMQMNPQVTFLSDGGETVRELQLYLNPNAEHLLDWFHLARQEVA